MSVINGRPAIRNLDVPPTFEWREQHEKIGSAVAFIFIVLPHTTLHFGALI